MYLIFKDVDNKTSAGNKFENCNFEFPINLKVGLRAEIKLKEDSQSLLTSEVRNYWFTDNLLYIDTQNSRYMFDIVCD